MTARLPIQLPNQMFNFQLRWIEYHASEENHNSVTINVSQAVKTTWWTRESCQSGAKLAILPFNLATVYSALGM
jgi:hypothetical protein